MSICPAFALVAIETADKSHSHYFVSSFLLCLQPNYLEKVNYFCVFFLYLHFCITDQLALIICKLLFPTWLCSAHLGEGSVQEHGHFRS